MYKQDDWINNRIFVSKNDTTFHLRVLAIRSKIHSISKKKKKKKEKEKKERRRKGKKKLSQSLRGIVSYKEKEMELRANKQLL